LAANRKRLDEVFVVMGAHVQEDKEFDEVSKSLRDDGVISSEELVAWSGPLSTTYQQILELHRKDWNGIWFRVVRNFFWSATAGSFDVVLGNPPWVRWSNLPEQYRERIKPTCERYGIFSQTKYHGGNELDISGMITYTVGDKWLKPSGVLVFVITQTHFQTPSSQGFRAFSLNNQYNLIPEAVSDLKSLTPFPKVANATAIMRLRKVPADVKATYPVPYTKWIKAKGYSATVPEAATKQQVYARVERNLWEATPVGDLDSPWAILPIGRFDAMKSVKGKSDWIQGRKGVTSDLNAVFMLRIVETNKGTGLVQVETRPEAGRRDIGPARKFWVEPDLLYPLLKGAADFSEFEVHPKEDLYYLIPNDGIRKASYETAQSRLKALPNTRKMLQHYKDVLLSRSTFKTRMIGAPFYSVYNVGEYTFAPYKVVWAEQSSTFRAAVFESASVPMVGTRAYVPDHKVYFSDFTNAEEAHYVRALLNCSLVKEFIESHTIQIQVSNIFKHVNLPVFDAKKSDHLQISQLSQEAHAASSDATRTALISRLNDASTAILTG
jgi:hypothetical protein